MAFVDELLKKAKAYSKIDMLEPQYLCKCYKG